MSGDVAAANAAAAAELLGALASLGLRRVVACPGSRNTPLLLAAEAHDALLVDVFHDERTAAFFALGLGRQSGVAAALITTSGSAIAHALPAAIEADASDVPLLLLSADRPAELHECAAAQTTRQKSLFASHARHVQDLGAPSDGDARSFATAAARAWAAAHATPPGPVHLNMPFREPLFSPEVPIASAQRSPRALVGRVQLAPEALADLASALDHPKTVIVVGPLTGSDRPYELRAALARLAEHRGWPLIADLATGLRHQEGRAPVIACADAIARCDAPSLWGTLEPQRVLAFGLQPTSKALAQRVAGWGGEHVFFDAGGRTRDPRHHASLYVAADPCHTVNALIALLPPQPASSFARAWQRADEVAWKELTQTFDEGLWSGVAARTLIEALPPESLLHLASSMAIRDAESYAGKASKRLHFASSRGVNGIDGTLATAAGEATIHQRPTALLIGDTALLHDVGSLHALRRRALPLTIVVLDNGGGGIFSHLPIADHERAFEKLFFAPHGHDLLALCQGAGFACRRVSTRDELLAALDAALGADSITVVLVPLDHADDRHRRLGAWSRASAALCQLGREWQGATP